VKDEKPEEFIEAIAMNERKFIKEYATPRMNYHRSLIEPDHPHEMLSLIDRYLQLTPAMVPSQMTSVIDIHSPTAMSQLQSSTTALHLQF